MIQELLRSGGRPVVVEGAVGMGKSALLHAALARAEGDGAVTMLTTPGGAGAFSTLSGLLASLEAVGAGTRPRTAAARLAVADVSGEGDRLRLGNRLLAALEEAGRAGPVVLAIDDLDLVDEWSRELIGFAVRRTPEGAVRVLATARGDVGPSITATRPRRLELTPLGDEAARRLLRQEPLPALADPVTDRIIREARGVPLLLRELPGPLTTDQRTGGAPLPGTLVLSHRALALFTDRLAELSRDERDVVAVTAVAGMVDAWALRAALGAAATTRGLAAAVEHRLLVVAQPGEEVRFAEPLLRSAVLQLWGRSEPAADDLGPTPGDEPPSPQVGVPAGSRLDHVAGALERGARAALLRGDERGAALRLMSAASCASTAGEGRRLRVEAAYLEASGTGQVAVAEGLLADAGDGALTADSTLRAAATSAQLLYADGEPLENVHDLLSVTLRKVGRAEGPLDAGRNEAYYSLYYVSLLAARQDLWATFHDLLAEQRPDLAPAVARLTSILPDIASTPAATVADLESAVHRLSDAASTEDLLRTAVAAYYLDRLGGCRAALTWVVEAGDRVGPHARSQASFLLALDDALSGQLTSASARVEQAATLGNRVGRQERLWLVQYAGALVGALSGDHGRVVEMTDRMRDWSTPRQAVLVDHFAGYVQGLDALGHGEFDTAFMHTSAISPPGELRACAPPAAWTGMDLVEAAVLSGRRDEAIAHADALERSGIARLSPRLALQVAGACAMVAAPEAATGAYERALAVPGTVRWPFERARLHLAYGQHLRRSRRAGAVEHLTLAFETFRRAGARSWATRAGAEMRAAGIPLPEALRPRQVELTGRDREIALLAAAGLTNRQIGDQLFLSPRTVGSRLYRVFPKLGITSRSELRGALREEPLD